MSETCQGPGAFPTGEATSCTDPRAVQNKFILMPELEIPLLSSFPTPLGDDKLCQNRLADAPEIRSIHLEDVDAALPMKKEESSVTDSSKGANKTDLQRPPKRH